MVLISMIKKIPVSILIVISLVMISLKLYGQNKIQVRFFQQIRSETQLSYNFFTGPDAGNFSGSIRGFGSGVLDLFDLRASADFVQIGTDKLFLSAGAGFAVLKYRLAKNLVFLGPQSSIAFCVPDPDPSHDYGSGFFSYGKSKIITTSFYFPVDLNLSLGKNVIFCAGGYLDHNLTARYKAKYRVGEDKVTEVIRSAEFRKFYPSTTKFGVSGAIYHRKWNVGIAASYSLTPFFKPGMGPDIHETRISLVLDEALWKMVK
jgi:hypothetical protein